MDAQLDQALYAKRQKIYPRQVHGLFARMRLTGVVVLMGIYYLTPWFTWNDRQAILWDLVARKFHIFGVTFWPQDFIYLSALLIIAALSLFFFTALAGRLWCGYACPQTVWTEVFLWIERKVEGDRSRQVKLAKGPWNFQKISKRTIKHSIWIGLSIWTGYTFVGYFTPIRELGHAVATFSTGPWQTFWIFFYGFATYGNAGWLREQVCIYMCPYARFQSAMFDRNTMIISYDKARGEPRGSRRKKDPGALGLGDCIDCTICVQVCPTGIDIRDGLQYECIGCASCIDACDDVMEKVGSPKGLIRYTTENVLLGKTTKILRPRIVVYGLILLSLLLIVGYRISQRIPLDLDVIRDRNTLYREVDEGWIENVYTLKILNKDQKDHYYRLSTSSEIPMTLKVDTDEIFVVAGEIGELIVRAQMDSKSLQNQSMEFEFEIASIDTRNLVATEKARFVGPIP
ncbi:MAG: cytochrome c oxidase accessory protein CcoG [Gammaproteobacteria bacterium]|nr:cytochrome c oxidase accessory protein CcoG [Gammaproteobacteria bacterium]